VVNADGTQLRQLTDNGSKDVLPRFSPDGKQIAFVGQADQNPSGLQQVFVMNADGTQLRQVTNMGKPYGAGAPIWSPDGKRIAFTTGVTEDFYVMNAYGTQLRLLGGQGDVGGWDWSPDGDHIVFASVLGTQAGPTWKSGIFVIDFEGTERQLTDTARLVSNRSPKWSPDGNKIAFVSDRDGDSEIYVMNTDGTKVSQLTDNRYPWDMAWLSGSKQIGFIAGTRGPIFLMNADGTDAHPIGPDIYGSSVDFHG